MGSEFKGAGDKIDSFESLKKARDLGRDGMDRALWGDLLLCSVSLGFSMGPSRPSEHGHGPLPSVCVQAFVADIWWLIPSQGGLIHSPAVATA